MGVPRTDAHESLFAGTDDAPIVLPAQARAYFTVGATQLLTITPADADSDWTRGGEPDPENAAFPAMTAGVTLGLTP